MSFLTLIFPAFFVTQLQFPDPDLQYRVPFLVFILPRPISIYILLIASQQYNEEQRNAFSPSSKHPLSPSAVIHISIFVLFLGCLNLKMEAIRLFETNSALYQSMRLNILEDVTSSTAVRTSNLASLHLLSIALQQFNIT